MTRVVVSGALANRPLNGGGAAVRVDWIRALEAVGFEVWFVEQVERAQLADSRGDAVEPEHSVQLAFFREVTHRAGLADRCILLDESGDRLAGTAAIDVRDLAVEAALLINLGGHLRLPSLLGLFRTKVFVDLDPGFTQIWHQTGVEAGIAGHDAYFTVGLNVGAPGCDLPVDGIHWRPLTPPVVLQVVLEVGPEGVASELDRFTTVASWRGTFGRLEHRGRAFGLKAHEFRKLLDLPRHVDATLEIALDIHPGDDRDLAALRRHGWSVVDPLLKVPDPDAYRAYIAGSGAELSVAQGIYVDTRCGWISDRTARYLAAGKPALVQDTGVADHLPVGEGLVLFRDLDEAVSGARAIVDDYESHCRGARQLAEEFFASDAVVGGLLEQVGVSP